MKLAAFRTPFGRDAAYAILANGTVAGVAVVSLLIVPRYIGVVEYGYWQLFVFYSSYTLMAQAGLGDGAYLRYGGMGVSQVRERAVSEQLIVLTLYLLPVTGLLILLAPAIAPDVERSDVVLFTAVYLAISNVRHFILLLFQAVGDFKFFSRATLVDRGVYLALIAALLSIGVREFEALIAAELIAKGASTGFALVHYRGLAAPHPFRWRVARKEALENVVAGSFLTISNVSNMLVLGVSRLAVDFSMGVAAFGRLSFALNLMSFFMIFVNAVGMVFFPFFRRSEHSRLADMFWAMRMPLSWVMLVVLVAMWPMQMLGSRWFPGFEPAFLMAAYLMPALVFETRMGLLVNPLLKTLREERLLLRINVVVICLSACSALFTVQVLGNLELLAAGIAAALFVRGAWAEFALLRRLRSAGSGLLERFTEAFLIGVYYLAFFALPFSGGFAVCAGVFGVLFIVLSRGIAGRVDQARALLRVLD